MPWVTCNVTKAGPAENGVIYIALRAANNSFHHWFRANASMEKEMLATALTSVSASKKVFILVVLLPIVGFSVCTLLVEQQECPTIPVELFSHRLCVNNVRSNLCCLLPILLLSRRQ